MSRAARRKAEQDLARQRRKMTRAMIRDGEIPPGNPYSAPPDASAAGPVLTRESMDDALHGQVAIAQERAAEFAAMTRKLIASIPEHLRETPEARLLVSRVQSSWMVPFHPKTKAKMEAEWRAFLEAQPENVERSAARSGLWTPGQR